jgi:hypothetical protein
VADAGDRQLEAAHPTPAGPLIPDTLVLLASGAFAFVELDRGTMSYARVLAKVNRYAACRTAPPPGRGNTAAAARPGPPCEWERWWYWAGVSEARALGSPVTGMDAGWSAVAR